MLPTTAVLPSNAVDYFFQHQMTLASSGSGFGLVDLPRGLALTPAGDAI